MVDSTLELKTDYIAVITFPWGSGQGWCWVEIFISHIFKALMESFDRNKKEMQ
jgi:hypothetical protein